MALFGSVEQGIFWLAVGLLLLLRALCPVLWGRKGRGEAGDRRPAAFGGLLPRAASCGLLVWIGAAAGMARMETEEWLFLREERLLEQAGTGLLHGTVEEIGESGSGKPRLVLKDCTLSGDGAAGSLRRVYCYVEAADGLRPGQRLMVSGSGEAAEPARNPGCFDYRLFCRAKGICGSFYGEGRARLTDPRYEPVSDFLWRLGTALGNRLSGIAEDRDAGILKAVLLGDKKEMDESVYELYRVNGVSHLLAISGLHVSVIGMGLWNGLRRCGLGFGAAGVLAGGFLLGYGGMVGFGPSVTRAVFMMLTAFLASWLGRTYDMPSAMCIPALGLLLALPYTLTQAAFQLSFLAAGSAFFPGRLLRARFPVRGRLAGLFQALIMSVSVQMMTAPVVLWHSFELPVYGIWLNLLVIPLMAYVLVSGIAGLLGSFAGTAPGASLLGGAHYVLRFYEWICGVFASLPLAVLLPGRPSWSQMLAFYLCLAAGGLCLWRMAGRKEGRWSFAGFWLLAFLFLAPARPDGLSVFFLDVGQGDGIYLELEGRTVLVDCGSSSDRTIGENSLVPFLRSRGVRRLDTVVVSHGDWDHISGIRYLLETPECGIRTGCLVMPAAGRGQEIYDGLEALAAAQRIPVVYLEKGQELPGLELADGSFVCIYPPSGAESGDRNGESLVLLLEYGSFRMLLTGDAGLREENAILREGDPGPVTVLKAGHHGSDSSSGEAFVSRLRPAHVILSYGEGNRYGHPAPEVTGRFLEAGSRLWETAEQGAIRLWTDGERMEIESCIPVP